MTGMATPLPLADLNHFHGAALQKLRRNAPVPAGFVFFCYALVGSDSRALRLKGCVPIAEAAGPNVGRVRVDASTTRVVVVTACEARAYERQEKVMRVTRTAWSVEPRHIQHMRFPK